MYFCLVLMTEDNIPPTWLTRSVMLVLLMETRDTSKLLSKGVSVFTFKRGLISASA